jgi:hypothetical protein
MISYVPPKERDANFLRNHHRTSQAVPEAMSYFPAKRNVSVLSSRYQRADFIPLTHLLGGVDKSRPLEFRHESPEKVGIEIGLPDFQLNVFEFQWEIIRVAILYMASQKVMCNKTDHRG